MKPFDFINRANADYIDRLYQQYQKDPRSLDEQWNAFFSGFEMGVQRSPETDESQTIPGRPTSPMGVFDLVHSFRELGHFVAKLDPLGHDRPNHPLLDLSVFGMTPGDLDREVGAGTFMGPTDGTLRDLIEKLRLTYCGTIGVEYTGIADKNQREWLQRQMEPTLNRPQIHANEAKGLMFQLIAAEEFEQFLHTRYIGQKRFSLEGAEALVPLLNTIVDEGAQLGAEKLIMAMAHRGRLNALAHVLNKPYEIVLSEFEGTSTHSETDGDGDVKYHLGYANERPLPKGMKVKVSLLPNPSHLELIDPIQQGIVRAQQSIFGDPGRSRVVPVCMHGDAAFTGQGIVFETLNLSELHGYRTGGTIHVIINNQIGFTTPPSQGRFTPYPTDVAKMIQAPIFHVNGDDPEAVIHAAKLAIAFRQEFKVDVMIDLWCYRRHGHNEMDEPEFTQPIMYKQIQKHATVRQIYAQRLLEEKRVTQAELDEMKAEVLRRLESAQALAKEVRPREKVPSFHGVWKGLARAGSDWSAQTAVSRDQLAKVADAATRVPAGFTVHPKLRKLLASRADSIKTGKGIDWGCAEMLAIGTLLLEGKPVRLTGQDAERGTFSHRHAVLHDFENGQTYIPLTNIGQGQAKFTIMNTMLSELAVLGFEWGFASADPRCLVIWEAQFGDFVNGAQSIIDQIIASSESKWRYMNGMVMLLPHGYEGQGPEHSNSYVERFLSLCADDNMQVCYPSTSAQYFHLLRRQMHRTFRKPLILMMPKSLLRLEASSARVEDLTDSNYQLIIDDPTLPDRARVKRLLLCSGKVYYTLAQTREAEKITDTAIVRVEQLYPFPKKELQQILAKYRGVQEVSWVQEEPHNRGAWSFIEPRLREMLPETAVLTYVGREEAASPATGIHKMHLIEDKEILTHALDLAHRRGAGNNGGPATSPAAASEASKSPATASPTPVSD